MTAPTYQPGDYVTVTCPLSGWIERPARIVNAWPASAEITIGQPGQTYTVSWCYVTGYCSRAAFERERAQVGER